MNYKTHLMGGALVGLVGVQVLNNLGLDMSSTSKILLVTTSTVGSLIPDIDHKGSYIGRRAKIASSIASSLFGHRGATHSPIPVTMLMAILYLLFNKYLLSGPLVDIAFIGSYLGIMSHILLDMITKGGIPLIYPISKKRFSLTNIKTGGFGEKVVLLGMVCASAVLIAVNYS